MSPCTYTQTQVFCRRLLQSCFTGSLALLLCVTVMVESKAQRSDTGPLVVVSEAGDPVASESEEAEKQRQPREITEEREAKILAFAGEYHPEIIPLLEVLKTNRTSRYQRVIRSLDKEIRSLNRVKKRSEELYAVALSRWVNRSKIGFLTAKVKTAKSIEQVDEIREKLKVLLREGHEQRIKAIEIERKLANMKVQQLDQALSELRAKPVESIEKRASSIGKLPARLKKAQARQKVDGDKKSRPSSAK